MNFNAPPDLLIMTLILTSHLLPAYLIGRWSQLRGNGFRTGFLISLFATPTVGALVVALTPSRSQTQPVSIRQ